MIKHLKQGVKNNYKQLILVAVILTLLLVFCFNSHFVRFWLSLKSFGTSIVYYFKCIFADPDVVIPEPSISYDYLIKNAGGSIFDLLPIDFEMIGHHLTMMFKLLINKTFWLNWSMNFSSVASIVVLVLNILLCLVIILAVLTIRHYKKDSSPEDTKALTWFKHFTDKISPKVLAIKEAIKRYFKKWLLITLAILAAFYFQLFTIGVDLIGNYYHFLAKFDFNVIWKGIVIHFVDFLPIYFSIPFIIRIILVYWLFDVIRLKIATDGIKDKENKMVEFLETSGNEILINGGSRAGKNALAVTFAVCYVQILFPKMILSTMLDIQRKFPFVNYAKLRAYVEEQKNNGTFTNQLDIYKDMFMRQKEYNQTHDPTIYFCDKYVKLNKWDGLTDEFIGHALTDYMLVYYFYIHKNPYSVSNYTIMFNDGVNPKQHYLNINHLDPIDETIKEFKKRNYNVVINYDYLRLGHKFNYYDSHEYYVPDVGLYTITEIGKERGNTDSVKKADGAAMNVNQKNDKFTERLKIWSHDSTIRFKTMFKLIADEQRNVGLNADTRSTFETIILLDKRKMKKKTSLKLWSIEQYLCMWLLNKYDDYSLERDENKQEQSLINYFIKKIIEKVNNYYYKRINKFSYTECNVYAQNGTTEGVNDDVESKKVFIIDKLSYSGRYETTSMKKLFLDEMAKAKLSFDDQQTFSNLTPSPLNWQSMRSFAAQEMFGFKYGGNKNDSTTTK